VDNLPAEHWLGCMIPKRHARRAVTRTLLKRVIRSRFGCHAERLPKGLWLVRLRREFDRALFVSAHSALLADAAGSELDRLLAAA
jgi:ribonuclease P protein component